MLVGRWHRQGMKVGSYRQPERSDSGGQCNVPCHGSRPIPLPKVIIAEVCRKGQGTEHPCSETP